MQHLPVLVSQPVTALDMLTAAVCIVKLQQLMEVTTASILGNVRPQHADHVLKVLCRFAFAPGKPGDVHLLSLNCLEKMAKVSSVIRMTFSERGYVENLIHLLAV